MYYLSMSFFFSTVVSFMFMNIYLCGLSKIHSFKNHGKGSINTKCYDLLEIALTINDHFVDLFDNKFHKNRHSTNVDEISVFSNST